MQSMDLFDTAELWVFVVGALIILGQYIFSRYRKSHPAAEQNWSVLTAHYMFDADVIPVGTRTVGDLHMSTIAVMPKAIGLLQGDQLLFHQVYLPYASKTHLLGLSQRPGASRISTRHVKQFEKVELEGDFPDYFQLYAGEDMQTLARYVLDPAAMAFIIDFCRHHSWEIVNNKLLVVEEKDGIAANNQQTIYDLLPKFVQEIRPAVESKVPLTENEANMPYLHDFRDNMNCPHCGQQLLNEQLYMTCPNGDGFLLGGDKLQSLKDRTLTLPDNAAQNTGKPETDLTCPSCNSVMAKVDYFQPGLIIDACTNCRYRWLDGGEAAKIAS